MLKIGSNLTQIAGPNARKSSQAIPGSGTDRGAANRKSTLVREIEPFSDRPYVTLDTALNRSLAVAEPQTLLNQAGTGCITVGEVQRAPDLLLTIKESVDLEKVNGRFLLTGSAKLLLMQRVSESLAGRARYLTLWPMTRREQLGMGACGVWETFFARPPRRGSRR